jgi:hypothetical protein
VPAGPGLDRILGYRHMTEAMQARVVAVIAERLAVALAAMPVSPRGPLLVRGELVLDTPGAAG